jgi:NitT/TauT family transport system substrate-binding protein
MNRRRIVAIALAGIAVLLSGCKGAASAPAEKYTIRVGYFPNITHSQALIGLARGDFQKALGDNVTVQATSFNAGP